MKLTTLTLFERVRLFGDLFGALFTAGFGNLFGDISGAVFSGCLTPILAQDIFLRTTLLGDTHFLGDRLAFPCPPTYLGHIVATV